ncbi:MAG: hydrolase 1, exosortase A system-associated [Gammaproteobacteria bacterium]|nr:hydrolase 1, exosortase A system-associated [Gammaproteobacteria bacterium]
MDSHPETPITFTCQDETLVGIVHHSDASAETGVLIVVGGPQYRAGSHRQFVLLARMLASNGIPVFRFDYRGMGDSSGELRTFEDVDQDIRAAIDTFIVHSPSIKKVVIWGLCDAASAALFYGHTDNRVSGMVLLNPWVRTEAGEARAYLKHYYLRRLTSKAFWSKVFSGKFRMGESVSSAVSMSKKASQITSDASCGIAPLPQRMLQGLSAFHGKVLFVLSEDDLTASEFRDLIASSREWKKMLAKKKAIFKDVQQANHTFSSEKWRSQVEHLTLDWLHDIS